MLLVQWLYSLNNYVSFGLEYLIEKLLNVQEVVQYWYVRRKIYIMTHSIRSQLIFDYFLFEQKNILNNNLMHCETIYCIRLDIMVQQKARKHHIENKNSLIFEISNGKFYKIKLIFFCFRWIIALMMESRPTNEQSWKSP